MSRTVSGALSTVKTYQISTPSRSSPRALQSINESVHSEQKCACNPSVNRSRPVLMGSYSAESCVRQIVGRSSAAPTNREEQSTTSAEVRLWGCRIGTVAARSSELLSAVGASAVRGLLQPRRHCPLRNTPCRVAIQQGSEAPQMD